MAARTVRLALLVVACVLLLGALGLDHRGHGVVGALRGGRHLGDGCGHIVEDRLHVLDRLIDDFLVLRNEFSCARASRGRSGRRGRGRLRRRRAVLVLLFVLVFIVVLVLVLVLVLGHLGRRRRCGRIGSRVRGGRLVLLLGVGVLASLTKLDEALKLLVRRGPDLLELRAGIGHLATGVARHLGRRLRVTRVAL